ncbi:MAG: hypothetical protein IKR33_05400 [Bacteroidales bacterium]|nr:hypothetical protein [Bacteroidales bacterium]
MGSKITNYWLKEYWPDLQKADFDSEDKIDTKLFTVSSGAIALLIGTLSFTEKHQNISLAIFAITFFGVSIILNIIYHFIATKNHRKQFDQITKMVNNEVLDDTPLRLLIKKGNRTLLFISIISMVLILIGFILAGIYILANVK